jgi:hypothetical protein
MEFGMKQRMVWLLVACAGWAFNSWAVEPEPGLARESVPDWVQRISVKGDLRLRAESMDIEGKERRDRGRIRARVSLKGEVNELVDARIRLATGGDNPVSTNQTLDEGFSTKDIGLDQAYVDFHPGDGDLNLWAGKMANPFMCVDDLIWDGDLNPEGLALKYKRTGERVTWLANGGGFIVDERKSDSDAFLYGAQLGMAWEPREEVVLTSGVAYYLYDNLAGFEPVWDANDGMGNSVVEVEDEEGATSLRYREEFGELELFSVLDFTLGLPVSLYTDFVVNTEAAREETAYMLGFTLNRAKAPGSWELDYNWRDLEADSVVGLFTDSDSFDGGTNAQGHRFRVKYQFHSNWQLGSTLFLSKLDPEGEDRDFTRFFADLVFQF